MEEALALKGSSCSPWLLTYMALTEHKRSSTGGRGRPFDPSLPSFGGLMLLSVALAKHVKWWRR